MAASASKLDDYKLETKFLEDCVVQTTYEWSSEERVPTVSTWKQVRGIGTGAFGSVWLQKETGGQLRAVKKLPQELLPGTGFLQELLASSKLKSVSTNIHMPQVE